MTLQAAIGQLNEVVTQEQVKALNERIDVGFVADVPTVQFSDADWPLWTDAVRTKAQAIEASTQGNV